MLDDHVAVVKEDWEDDEDVKDSWDAEEEEEAPKPAPKPKAAPKPKPAANKTPAVPAVVEPVETEFERKQRLERLVQEKDLESAMNLFGVSDTRPNKDAAAAAAPSVVVQQSPFDAMDPTTPAEFDQFTRIITKRLEQLESKKNYSAFLEGLVNALMSRRDVPEIRKVAGILTDMAALKLKEKQAASKTSAKAPPSLKGTSKKGTGRFDDFDFVDGDGFDD